MEETHLKTRKNLFVVSEEGHHVVFDPEEGDEWTLNETGAFIVKNLVEGASLEEIKNKMIEEYEVDQEDAEKALQAYIDVLKKEGIILPD